MAVNLSTADIDRLQRVMRVLLSPSRYVDLRAWAGDWLSEAALFMGADSARLELRSADLELVLPERADAADAPTFALEVGGSDWGACLTLGYYGPRGRELARGRERSGLLLPILEAGTEMAARRGCRADGCMAAFDRLGLALAMLDRSGSVLRRNQSLEMLLAEENDPGQIEECMGALARGESCPGEGRHHGGSTHGCLRIRIDGAAYLIAEASCPALQPRGTLVAVQRGPGALPPAEHLMNAYGLTRREAEVSLLLAAGESDRTIAARLTVSPHTVRKHAEHAFAKLGVHTRKALGLFLLEGTTPASPPPNRSGGAASLTGAGVPAMRRGTPTLQDPAAPYGTRTSILRR